MKQKVTMVVAIALAIFLAACGSSAAGQHFGDAVADWRPGAGKENASYNETPAEIVPYSSPEFGESLGFNVVSYPDSEDLEPIKFFALEGWMGQIEYKTPDERALVVRVAEAAKPDVAATYQDAHATSDETKTVDGIDVRVRTGQDGTLVSWARGDYQYALHSSAEYDAPSDKEIEVFVKELDAAPVV